MFHMVSRVESAAARGCRLLGWAGVVVGPVLYGGVRFWASARIDSREHERRRTLGVGALTDRDALQRELSGIRRSQVAGRPGPPLRLDGCLVESAEASAAVRDASLLAGYTARAVLVPDQGNVLALLADAALLDQGVLLQGPEGVTLLAQAGPRIAAGIGFHAREWELLESVYEVFLDQALLTAS